MTDLKRLSPAALQRRLDELLEQVEPIGEDQARKLLHELQVHQVELEMQNRELRDARGQLEESRDRYTDLYDFAPVGYLTLDRRGQIQASNLSAANLLGLPRERLTGQPLLARLGKGQGDLLFRYLSQVFAEDANAFLSRQIELRLAAGDPPRSVLLETSVARPADGGRPQHCYCALTDITDRKAAEQALRESEVRFRALFEQAPVGINLVSPQGRPLFNNPAMRELLGYSETELAAGHFNDWTHPEDRASSQQQVQRLVRGQADHFVMEKRYLRKDGGILWALTSVSAVRKSSGELDYFISLVQDITERTQARQELEQRLDELERFSRVSVDRELEMIALKQQVNALSRELGREPPYPLGFLDNGHRHE